MKVNTICEIENCNKPKKISRKHCFRIQYFTFCGNHHQEWKKGIWVNENGKWLRLKKLLGDRNGDKN